MSFSADLQDNLLDHMLLGSAFTSPSSLFLALGTDDEGEFVELSGNGYSRKPISFLRARGRDMEFAEIRNDAAVAFDEATADWTGITDFAIYDNSSNQLARFVACDSVTVPDGDSLTLGPEELGYSIAMSAYPLSLQRAILDHVFAGVSWSQPASIYVAACVNNVFHGMEAADIEEPSGGGYARVQHTNWSVGGQSGGNVGNVNFPTATANWPDDIVGIALFDASSGGNLLAATPLESAVTINNGDVLRVGTSSIAFRMDKEDSEIVEG